MNKDIEVLKKVYDEADNYNWAELETYDDYFKSINFPEDAEQFINSFYTEPTNAFAVVVGSYRTRFYTEEEKYVWRTIEYAAIVSLTLDKPFNTFFITDKNYEYLNKNHNFFNTLTENKYFNLRKTNLVKELYKKVSRNVSKIEDIYSAFLKSKE